MKAIVVRKPGGLENTKVEDIKKPENSVVIKVTHAGLNPVDMNVISGKVNYNISPYPHIPGAEFTGIVERVSSSKKFRVGDRVLVYPRIYDGTCDWCNLGMEEQCRNGTILGVGKNGGFSEFFGTDEDFLEPLPDSLSFEDAVSIPVGGLTAYHALKRVGLKNGERLLVIGASGNTGWYSVILGRLMGASVSFVSRKKWIKETGASEWKQEKVDVIVNSLGTEVWDPYTEYLDKNGRVVTFGSLTGREVKLNIASLYTGERSIIGSTGGTRKEFAEFIKLVSQHGIKSRLWKTYGLEEFERAISEYPNREGRIILKVSDV